MPKVSIVLPTYNGEKYIRESIDSIISQTFKDWELIVVDDCSMDNTGNIVEGYKKKDQRIKIIHNEQNQKLPRSLNIGFRKAQGEYLTWTSDDNLYLPNALESMAKYLDEHDKTVMVCTAMNKIDYNGLYIQKHREYSYEEMLYNDCVGASFMYRKCVLNDIGEYNPRRFLVEDYDYWLRILFYYGRIDYIDQVEYLYRIHKNSLTVTRNNEIRNQLLDLRMYYINNIISGLENRKDLLFQIYYEFKFAHRDNFEIKRLFCTKVPEIGREKESSISGKVVIYGAGNYGRKAYERYKKKVLFFVDQNQHICGNKINSIDIVSPVILKDKKQNYEVVIAVSPEKIYSCITSLEEYGINKYYVFIPEIAS